MFFLSLTEYLTGTYERSGSTVKFGELFALRKRGQKNSALASALKKFTFLVITKATLSPKILVFKKNIQV